MKHFLSTIFFFTIIVDIYAQHDTNDVINLGRLYGLALNQDIKNLLIELDSANALSNDDKDFKAKYEDRFKNDNDLTEYFLRKDTTLSQINRIYQDYCRK